MRTETGVMLVKDGRAWGTAYEDGHSRDFGWVSLELANIYNPKFCKAPTDVVYAGSPDTAEVRTGKITRVRRVTTTSMKRIQIYTDGGCRGNPGIGGWAAILVCGEHRKEISGSAQETTNNRMELIAALGALEALKQPCSVELFSDSEYVTKGLTEWAPRWQRNGWKTGDKKPVKNGDLWRPLLAEAGKHDLTCTWVRGHTGHPENERCDKLANDEMDKLEQNRA